MRPLNTKPGLKNRPPFPPARSDEQREQQLVGLAADLAEEQMRAGTASSQVITHYLKLGTRKESLERDILEKQKELISAKTEAIKSAKLVEELYLNAINAMRTYKGEESEGDDND